MAYQVNPVQVGMPTAVSQLVATPVRSSGSAEPAVFEVGFGGVLPIRPAPKSAPDFSTFVMARPDVTLPKAGARFDGSWGPIERWEGSWDKDTSTVTLRGVLAAGGRMPNVSIKLNLGTLDGALTLNGAETALSPADKRAFGRAMKKAFASAKQEADERARLRQIDVAEETRSDAFLALVKAFDAGEVSNRTEAANLWKKLAPEFDAVEKMIRERFRQDGAELRHELDYWAKEAQKYTTNLAFTESLADLAKECQAGRVTTSDQAAAYLKAKHPEIAGLELAGGPDLAGIPGITHLAGNLMFPEMWLGQVKLDDLPRVPFRYLSAMAQNAQAHLTSADEYVETLRQTASFWKGLAERLNPEAAQKSPAGKVPLIPNLLTPA